MLKLSAAFVLAAGLTVAGHAAFAQAEAKKTPPGQAKKAAASSQHVMLNSSEWKWGPGPPALPPGGQAAVLDGDPGKAGGHFTMVAKIPDGYKVPPHWHPTDENLAIVSGTLLLGMGDKMDQANMHAINAGGFAKMPAKEHHSAMAKGETIFYVYGVGPFDITYLNPNDDPRKKSTSK